MASSQPESPASEIIFYQGEDGRSRIQVRLEGGTVWLTQRLLAELYQVTVPAIHQHIGNIFEEGELDPAATVKKFLMVQTEGTREVRRAVDHYNLEMILAVRDLYALSVDYDPSTAETKTFFQIVQNKLHWAITGQTAPEIIAQRADASKPNMGLTSWKGAKVRRGDVTVAKNYLTEEEIRQMNRIVTRYLDYAEDQAQRRRPLYMRDWREKLDAFLRFDERDILTDAGRVAAAVAEKLALEEYEKFDQKRRADELAEPDLFEEATRRIGPAGKGKG